MAKKEKQQVKQEQPKQGAWTPVDLKAEGMQKGAQYGGILEMLRHCKQRYTLVKRAVKVWRGGRYQWQQLWQLRDGGKAVHEVQPRARLDVAMQEAEAYIAEAEAAAREIETGRERHEQLPGGMTEEQFDKIFEDDEE